MGLEISSSATKISLLEKNARAGARLIWQPITAAFTATVIWYDPLKPLRYVAITGGGEG